MTCARVVFPPLIHVVRSMERLASQSMLRRKVIHTYDSSPHGYMGTSFTLYGLTVKFKAPQSTDTTVPSYSNDTALDRTTHRGQASKSFNPKQQAGEIVNRQREPLTDDVEPLSHLSVPSADRQAGCSTI